MTPLRASDGRGVLVAPPSDEVFPGGSASEPWRAGDDNGDRIELEYAAGGAHASIEGEGELAITLDPGTGDEQRSAVAVRGPGLYDLALHPRHERHTISIAATGDLAIYSLSFSAGVP